MGKKRTLTEEEKERAKELLEKLETSRKGFQNALYAGHNPSDIRALRENNQRMLRASGADICRIEGVLKEMGIEIPPIIPTVSTIPAAQ